MTSSIPEPKNLGQVMSPQALPSNVDTANELTGIRFTIPDKPPAEQLKMVQDMKQVMQTFHNVTGEKFDPTPFDEVIAKLEAELAKEAEDGN